MGSRRRLRRALLIAAAVLLVLAGGVAAAVLAGSDGGDDPVLLGGPADSTDEPTKSDGPAETDSAADLPIPTDTEQQPEPQQQPEAELGDNPSSGGGGAPRQTNFPRERRQAQDDPPQRVFAVPPARVFTGSGNARLGTVNVREAAIVKWTTTGRFELRFGREAFPIIAPSPSGQLVVPAFNFEQVRVVAKGRWKIRITPQG